jgi:hypothetical protein
MLYKFLAFSFTTTTGNIPRPYAVPNIVVNNILCLLTVYRGMCFNLRETDINTSSLISNLHLYNYGDRTAEDTAGWSSHTY